MPRRAWSAVTGVALALLLNGCASLRGEPRDDASPATLARRQELDESAQAAIDRRQLPEARSLLDQLVAENPRSPQAHQRMGEVLKLQGDYDGAAAEYRKALDFDKDYVDALIGLGEINHLTGRDDVALKRFAQAIEIDPNQASAHLGEGLSYQALGRTSEALASYFRALEIDPNSAETIIRAAEIQLSRNQAEQALARLDQALELSPDSGEGRRLRGATYLALGRPDAAADDLKIAAEKLPGRADVFLALAQALAALKKTPEAIAAAENALKLNPASVEARNLSEGLKR